MAVGTLDQLATYLTDGYWTDSARTARAFDHTNITVDFSSLQAQDQVFAQTALDLWADISGLTFTSTTGTADISFQDTQANAYSNSIVVGAAITSSIVNIDQTWAEGLTDELFSYRLQTFIHEIGHAVGLGHSGNYNNSASYPTDATFDNDSWQLSVMSYFDQSANTTVTGSYTYVLTPQLADIIAMQNIYGSGTARSGDTIYGDGNTTGSAIYGTSIGTTPTFTAFPSITIFDAGGIDLLNYSGTAFNQVINLDAESMSSIYGMTNNVIIARGTVIENATGGSGDDVINGNSINNVLTGGAGMDILNGGVGNDRLVAGAALEQGEEYNGGFGFDTLDLSGLSAGYFVNLGTGAISGGTGLGGGGFFTATVSGIEIVEGSSGDDRLVGNSSS
ncbi:MAG: serine 3-dehydrogenase, partial [Alphaproteobacteria bacterium]|nr:serine 3-dehydrogenase [Alphaproteobacteria bacterium]